MLYLLNWNHCHVLLLFFLNHHHHFYPYYFVTFLIFSTNIAIAMEQCSINDGGGVCPDSNTCCAMSGKITLENYNDGNKMSSSGCITHSSHDHGLGECCSDDGTMITGCGAGFFCASSPMKMKDAVMNTREEEKLRRYYCERKQEREDHRNDNSYSKNNNSDKSVLMTKPRYHLISSSSNVLGRTFGFPVMVQDPLLHGDRREGRLSSTSSTTRKLYSKNNHPMMKHILAYQSSNGRPIAGTTIKTTTTSKTTTKTTAKKMKDKEERKVIEAEPAIKIIIIVIHGSGRTSDDYLYSAMVASRMQNVYPIDSVLIIAPRFLAVEDGDIDIYNDENSKFDLVNIMRWNVTYPIPHSWRYGANALPPSHRISSYDALDSMVEHFASSSLLYPNLENIVVIGHSAGGQFVHRWALTSNIPAWKDNEDEYQYNKKFKNYHSDIVSPQRRNMPVESRTNNNGENNSIINNNITQNKERFDFISITKEQSERINTSPSSSLLPSPQILTIVANPRSFCYLDARRIMNTNTDGGSLEIPSQESIDECPNYNRWEWGLEDGGPLLTPYKDRALKEVGGDVTRLAKRYSLRNVTYLAGKDDTIPLVRSCETDNFQGVNRRERSERYFRSLELYFGHRVHERRIVDCVGHDHALMFESRVGLEVIFGV